MLAADIYEVRDTLARTTHRLVDDDLLRARVQRRLALMFPDDIDPADVPPPLLMHRIALALGLPRAQALPLAHAGCFYYAAADLADDLVDTPAAPATDLEARLGVNDVCVLLFLCQQALLEIPSPHMPALASLFARSGLVMAGGQARDLAFSDTLDAGDPIAIARGKTGGELAALVAAPIVLAGGEPGPWLDFGRALGTLLQVFTDYLDLFAKETSDDWRDAKPTLPIRHALSHPVHGRAAALLLAGARHAVSRQQAARFLMIEAGTAPHYRTFADARLAEMDAACTAAGRPAILETLLSETRELSLAVDDALAALAEVESAPTFVSPEDEAAGCLRAALAFLAEDPVGEEATEHHRWGLFGRAHVQANLFGQLVVAEALRAAGRDNAGYAAAALGRRDPDGWRYYPGCGEIPPDADLTGLALQVLTGPGRRNEALIAASVATLRDNLTEDALIPTWLEVGTGLAVPQGVGEAAVPLRWIGERCPASMANAVMGWHRAQPDDPDVRRAADRLVAWFDAPGPPTSAFYGPVVVDALGLLMLTEFGAPEHAAVRGRIAARLAGRRRASGHFGTPLDTAWAAIALQAAGRLAAPEVVRRALVDAQSADGGYPACPFYVTVGAHHEPGTYASRLVTTAVVVRALTALSRAGGGADPAQRGGGTSP
jgi:geranylgeranyl pyrophosphate synthase